MLKAMIYKICSARQYEHVSDALEVLDEHMRLRGLDGLELVVEPSGRNGPIRIWSENGLKQGDFYFSQFSSKDGSEREISGANGGIKSSLRIGKYQYEINTQPCSPK